LSFCFDDIKSQKNLKFNIQCEDFAIIPNAIYYLIPYNFLYNNVFVNWY